MKRAGRPSGRFVRASLAVLPFLIITPAFAASAFVSSAISIPSTFAADPQPLPAQMIAPAGTGPFPAVVVMHDCSGLGPKSSGAPGRWSTLLAAEGYVAIMPDSFSPRGLPDGVCTTAVPAEQRRTVGESVRDRDAYSTLAYLRGLPFIDKTHIGIMGGSHGGSATLTAMVDPGAAKSPIALAKRDGFQAGIALYPGCGGTYGDWRVTRQDGDHGPMTGHSGTYRPIGPLLILIGERDDWTPASDCQAMEAQSDQAGLPVTIKTYPGAWHSFDSTAPVRYFVNRNNATKESGRGATTGGNPAAWADSIVQVKAFFGKYLKK